MTFVSQSEFARMCGVSRQAVLRWKSAGRLVLQGNQVDVEATHLRMQRLRVGGSPLRRELVDTVDSRLTNQDPVDKNARNLSTDEELAGVDGTQKFDFSRVGLTRRLTAVTKILGFEPAFDHDDIDLRLNGMSHFCCAGLTFDENAFIALDQLRWWFRGDQSVSEAFRAAIPLLATPLGTPTTAALCAQAELEQP
jgi:hypothetical protein